MRSNTRQDSALQLSTTSHSTIMNTARDNTSSPKTKNHPDENRTRQTGPWSKEEDDLLLALIKTLGNKSWKAIGEEHGRRDGKQCRERWVNHLDHDLNLEPFTEKEDQHILQFYQKHGSKWALIFHRSEAKMSVEAVLNHP
ncbi:1151_t:CDS:2 [Ambispora gerdemannii]|uniref:1151_t:CDS:1 n=1 Tax=Ambispora gerdemannii TaxID=144530 RepID=A0A9N9GHC7_9GLOM|nr:1151_t:CDS:2 [Ambispora gerdemannii]